MKVICLGTGGYHPSDLRQTACMMLPSEGIALDAGTAFFRVREHLETDHLDILLTHAHLDHAIGLTYLFDVMRGTRLNHVRVHAEENKIVALREHLFSKELFPVQPPLEFVPLSDQTSLNSDCKLTWFPLSHPGGSVGFRLDWPDRSMAYVTDTTASTSAKYTSIIMGVDLLIHECYFADGEENQASLTGHSTASAVAEVAKRCRVGKMVVVHVNPSSNTNDPVDLSRIQEVFPESELGVDRMEIEF